MNETEESKKLSSNNSTKNTKRPTMRLYTPPVHPIKRGDSLNDPTTSSKNTKENNCYELKSKEDLREDLFKKNFDEDYSSFKSNQSDNNKSNNKTAYKFDDKLNDCFKKTLNFNEQSRASSSNSKSTSPQLSQGTNYSSDDEFNNMLEVYDLSPDLKSQDIRSSLYQLQTGDFEIRWVNDTRAIIIFSAKSIAHEALKLPCHNLKLRKLSQGSAESKQKARECGTNLPFKQRPETSAILARRLVSGALGIRVSVSAEQRQAEKKKLQDARDRKHNREKQLKSAWDGE